MPGLLVQQTREFHAEGDAAELAPKIGDRDAAFLQQRKYEQLIQVAAQNADQRGSHVQNMRRDRLAIGKCPLAVAKNAAASRHAKADGDLVIGLDELTIQLGQQRIEDVALDFIANRLGRISGQHPMDSRLGFDEDAKALVTADEAFVNQLAQRAPDGD